jgi:HAD superfamily hydrolase (TIGR01509 family)
MGKTLSRPLAGVRGVVFDLDGTLVDSYDAIALGVNAARKAFGLAPLPRPDVRRRVGRGLEALMADVLGKERADAGVRIFRERYAEVYAAATSALPGALDTLRELRSRGYRMAVASNKLARFGGPILEHLGMAGFLTTVEGPDTAGAPKPEPPMIERCLRAMGVGPEEALYVGDMVLDVETALRAGVPVILVPGGSSEREDLLRTGATVLGSLVEILEILPPLEGARDADRSPA